MHLQAAMSQAARVQDDAEQVQVLARHVRHAAELFHRLRGQRDARFFTDFSDGRFSSGLACFCAALRNVPVLLARRMRQQKLALLVEDEHAIRGGFHSTPIVATRWLALHVRTAIAIHLLNPRSFRTRLRETAHLVKLLSTLRNRQLFCPLLAMFLNQELSVDHFAVAAGSGDPDPRLTIAA